MARVGKVVLNIPDEWFIKQLQSQAPELEAAANKVGATLKSTAKSANGDGAPNVLVSMKRDRGGRPVAMVILAEPNGVAQQAKRGVVTRAAAANGLDVHRYEPK